MPRKKGLNLPKTRFVELPCSIWKRLSAFLIDLLLLDVIVFGPLKDMINNLVPIDFSYGTSALFFENNPDIFSRLMVIFMYISFVVIVYFSVLEFKFGQTIGKMLMGIYVKTSNKVPLTFLRILLSNIIFIPVFPFILFWIIDPLYIFFGNRRFSEKLTNIELVQQVQV